MFENTLNGMPICRALFLNDPHDKTLYNDKLNFLDNEFFVGKDLLVAPIVEKEADSNGYGKRDVYLPQGSDWYCFMDNKQPLTAAEEGGTTVREFDAHIDGNAQYLNFTVPIYVRAGAIIPTTELEQYMGELNSQGKPRAIALNIYPGETGEYTMYLDDGVSRSSGARKDRFGGDPEARDEYRETRITHSYIDEQKRKREIKVERVHDNYQPFEEYFFVAVLHDPSESQSSNGSLAAVRIDGQTINLISANSIDQRSQELQASDSNGWYYNENINISFIKVFDRAASITIQVEYV